MSATAVLRVAAAAAFCTALASCAQIPASDRPPAVSTGFAALPFSVPVRTREFAAHQTAGELVSSLALRLGYTLVLDAPSAPNAATIARWPVHPGIFAWDTLPAETLVNGALHPGGVIVIDHVNRLVSFARAPEPEPGQVRNPLHWPVAGRRVRLAP